MNRTIIISLLMLFAISINAQTARTGQKGRSTVTASKGRCGVCKGKGYLICPTCKGKAVVMKRGDEYLCETCTVNEGAECLSSSSAACRIAEANPDMDFGNVKCPYCKTKTRMRYKAISKAKYEHLKR